MATTIDTTNAPKKTSSRVVISGILALGAFALLIMGNRAAVKIAGSSKITTTWGDWFTLVGLFAAAGFVFGLAAVVPRSFRYRPSRALVLGILPLLGIVEMMLVAGPTSAVNFTQTQLGYLYDHPIKDLYYFGLWVLPVLLGVSIAAGFRSSD
jgi:hypothetical protein